MENPVGFIPFIIIPVFIALVVLIVVCGCCCACCGGSEAYVKEEIEILRETMVSEPKKILFTSVCSLCLEKFDDAHMQKMEDYANYLLTQGHSGSGEIQEPEFIMPLPQDTLDPSDSSHLTAYPSTSYLQPGTSSAAMPPSSASNVPNTSVTVVADPPHPYGVPSYLYPSSPYGAQPSPYGTQPSPYGVQPSPYGTQPSPSVPLTVVPPAVIYEEVDWNQGSVSEVEILQCGHQFHRCCMNEWLSSNNECPFCKAINPRSAYIPNSATVPQDLTAGQIPVRIQPKPVSGAYVSYLENILMIVKTPSYSNSSRMLFYTRTRSRYRSTHQRSRSHSRRSHFSRHGSSHSGHSHRHGHAGGHSRACPCPHSQTARRNEKAVTIARMYNTAFGKAEMEGRTCYANALAVAVHMTLAERRRGADMHNHTDADEDGDAAINANVAGQEQGQGKHDMTTMETVRARILAAFPDSARTEGYTTAELFPTVLGDWYGLHVREVNEAEARAIVQGGCANGNGHAEAERGVEAEGEAEAEAETEAEVEAEGEWMVGVETGTTKAGLEAESKKSMMERTETTISQRGGNRHRCMGRHRAGVVLASYWLPKRGWDRFDAFYNNHARDVLRETWVERRLMEEEEEEKKMKKKRIMEECCSWGEDEDRGEGHLVLLTSVAEDEKENEVAGREDEGEVREGAKSRGFLTFLNSWGRAWGDDGFFHVESTTALTALAGAAIFPDAFRSPFSYGNGGARALSSSSPSSSSSSSSSSFSHWIRFYHVSDKENN